MEASDTKVSGADGVGWLYVIIDQICSRYGWTKDEVLTKVYVVELPYLLGTIRKQVANELLTQLAIVCSASDPKLAKRIQNKLRTDSMQAVGKLPSPLDDVSPEVRERILELRKKTRK